MKTSNDYAHLIQDKTYYLCGQVPVRFLYHNEGFPGTKTCFVVLQNREDHAHPLFHELADQLGSGYCVTPWSLHTKQASNTYSNTTNDSDDSEDDKKDDKKMNIKPTKTIITIKEEKDELTFKSSNKLGLEYLLSRLENNDDVAIHHSEETGYFVVVNPLHGLTNEDVIEHVASWDAYKGVDAELNIWFKGVSFRYKFKKVIKAVLGNYVGGALLSLNSIYFMGYILLGWPVMPLALVASIGILATIIFIVGLIAVLLEVEK